MPKAYQQWKVMPHGPLVEIDDEILTVVGQIHMPLGNLPRRMTVVRLRDSRLLIWSAIALDDKEMAKPITVSDRAIIHPTSGANHLQG